METKVCSKCGIELPKSEFYRNANAKDGLQSCCRACSNKMSAESHRRKADKVKEQLKKLNAMEAKQKPVEQPKHKVYTNPVLAPITPREQKLDKQMQEHQKLCDEIMAIQGIEPIEAEDEHIVHCPQGYQFVDENGNVINTTKIVLEKKPDDKLKLESTKKVREYWSEYTRIYIEIYDDEPNECILTHLLTLEGHRQKGYGKQALIQAEEIAKELGCHKAHLKVETNSWMHNWYLRCGYSWYKNANEGYTWLTKNL